MANNLLSVWSTIGSVLLALLILLVMITIHEFGHYVVGKLLKFKINEFAIGFGPALFKKKRKKTGELFSIRLIPLGGYCAFAGEDGDDEEKKKKPPEPFEETAQAEGEQPQTVEDPPKPQDKSGYFTHKKPWQRIIVLVAGAFMNYLLALFLIILLFGIYGQTLVAVYEAEPPTEEIAAEYCLQDYDILLEANGRSLYLATDLAVALKGKKEGDLVKMKVSRAIGFEWVTDPETGKKKGSVDHREVMTIEVQLRADVTVKNSADTESVYRALGFLETREKNDSGKETVSYAIASAQHRFGFFETIGRSFVYSFKIAGSIFRVIGDLFTGRLGLNSIGGPVTTIKTTSEVVSMGGFRGFLEIAAFIGVNLAVFNLLPIPALDGSKIVFTVIEWIRGKPINRKVEAIIHTVGIVLLLGFAILVDILQFV